MALLVAEPGRVCAQPDPDGAEESAAARAMFQQGVQHADRQEWTEAADRFRRAMDLRASPVIAFNLAQALVHLNRLVEASEHLRFTVRAQDANRNIHNSAERLLAQIQPRLATLTVHLRGAPEGAEVRLDGEVLSEARIGVGTPADPGHHRITAHRGGSEVAAGEVDLTDGGSGEVSLDVPPPPPVPAPEEVTPEEHRDTAPDLRLGPPEDGRDTGEDDGGSVLGEWWFWAIVGVAVAGGVTATLLLTRSEPDPVQGSFMPGVIEVR